MSTTDDFQPDARHFTKAVTALGEKRPVLTTAAIFNEKGVKVLDKGVAINAGMYERLMQHKLSEPIENSVASVPTVDGDVLRQTADNILANTPFFARMAQGNGMRTLLMDAVSNVPLPAPIAFQATLSCEVGYDGFIHSVQVALVASWLAHTPSALRFDIGMAAAAGLLHDIGMLHLDPVLMQPEHALDSDQRRQLYSHPLIATVLLKRHHEYSTQVIRAVEEHHECIDGSGYPRNLAQQAISPLGRILGLAEVVAAMFAPGRLAPEMRLSVLLRMNTHRFDEELVARVMKLLQPDYTDTLSTMDMVLDDPVGRLYEIDDAIAQWPIALLQMSGLSRTRKEGLESFARQVTQLQRTLAKVGIAREQLQQIGDGALDDALKVELSLLASEAAWQLRAMARQLRRRWKSRADGLFPLELETWLTQVDALMALR